MRAPITAANFLKYVDAGLFDGGRFFRTVRPDNQVDKPVKIAVIQAAGSRERAGEFFPAIPLERTNVTALSHKDGTLSMARSTPDTARDSFSICVGDQPALDFGGARQPDGQGFAAFGQVVTGHGRRAQDPGCGRQRAKRSPRRLASSACAAGTARSATVLQMVLKLATVTLVALFSLSPPFEQDTAALKREIEALKAQQAEMQKRPRRHPRLSAADDRREGPGGDGQRSDRRRRRTGDAARPPPR